MSVPRSFARHLLFLTFALVFVDVGLLVLSGEVVGMVLFGGSLALHMALGAGWRLRAMGRMRTPARRAIWNVAAVLYGAVAFGIALSGGTLATVALGVLLNASALVLAVGGSVAEHRRTRERVHFVMRAA